MSYVGKCLVAHPNLPSTNWFHNTVIYIYQEHARLGTLGLCLNVPTTASVRALLNTKGIIYPEGISQVHKGGPVNEQAIFLLHSDEWESGNTISAGPGYRLSSDEKMLELLSNGYQPAYWRMFVGICGWGPGQLEAELKGTFPYTKENSWLVCNASDELLFGTDSEKQWTKALEISSSQMFDQYI